MEGYMDSKLNISGFNSAVPDFSGGRAPQPQDAGAHISGAYQAGTRKQRYRKASQHGKNGRSCFNFRSLALLSLCAACFGFAFAFETTGVDFKNGAVNVMQNVVYQQRQQENNEGEDADELGRLRLVELPSIIDIFAGSSRPVMPVSGDRAVLNEDSLIAKIYAPAGTEISSVLDGTVKSVDPVSERGGLVIISHKNDVDIYYYGLSEISVERGQPVPQGSSLGILGGDTLYLKITKGGAPIDPFEFLGIKAKVG